jgi:DNA primase
MTDHIQIGRRSVRLTHPERVLFPGDGVTKRDLAEYYIDIGDAIVPHLRDRPFTLKRYPHGIAARRTFTSRRPMESPHGFRRAASSPGRAEGDRGSSTSRS